MYRGEVVSSLVNNSESWIGMKVDAIDILKDFQNRFIQGTPSCIVELDVNMMLMKEMVNCHAKEMTYLHNVKFGVKT